jgi:hypothetical protein
VGGAVIQEASMATEKTSPEERFYSFRIEVEDIEPLIWREFYVPATISLAEFHDVIQKVMGWDNDHLYAFTIAGEHYYDPQAETVFTSQVVDQITLAELAIRKGQGLRYKYDFGDDWSHRLKVLSSNFQPPDPARRTGCLGGARACPAEDCGGTWGYDRLLEIKYNPKPDDEEFFSEWAANYDPEKFDLDEINRKLG